MIAPDTEPMPPMTTMATRLSESLTRKKFWVNAMLAIRPGQERPTEAGKAPASAKALELQTHRAHPVGRRRRLRCRGPP